MPVIGWGVVGHLVEWRIEENVSVGGIGNEEVERCVARADNGYRALDYVCAVKVSQIASLAKRLELGRDIGPELVAGGFEIDE